MTWLARLKKLECPQETTLQNQQNPPFAGFVGAHPGPFENSPSEGPTSSGDFPEPAAVEVWAAASMATGSGMLSANQDAITEELPDPDQRQSIAPMTAEEETAIQLWLSYSNDPDPTVNAEVLGECRTNLYAREYFRWLSDGVPRAGEVDERPSCSQCSNLSDGQCFAAWPGEMVFKPVVWLALRCPSYATAANGGRN